MNHSKEPVLGIDIGRVIINAADRSGHSDTAFLSGTDEAALATPPSAGAFEAIRELTRAFEGRVWLVSKCGPRIQQLTGRWLYRHAFYEQTGVQPDHVLFCLKRPQKRQHCSAIGATHFVDDRLEVLEHLVGLVPHLYWFGFQRSGVVPAWAQRTLDWAETRRVILSGLRHPSSGNEAARDA